MKRGGLVCKILPIIAAGALFFSGCYSAPKGSKFYDEPYISPVTGKEYPCYEVEYFVDEFGVESYVIHPLPENPDSLKHSFMRGKFFFDLKARGIDLLDIQKKIDAAQNRPWEP